jgi:hypothetical protein
MASRVLQFRTGGDGNQAQTALPSPSRSSPVSLRQAQILPWPQETINDPVRTQVRGGFDWDAFLGLALVLGVGAACWASLAWFAPTLFR